MELTTLAHVAPKLKKEYSYYFTPLLSACHVIWRNIPSSSNENVPNIGPLPTFVPSGIDACDLIALAVGHVACYT